MSQSSRTRTNKSIELYRILFTLIICIHHAKVNKLISGCAFLKHGYLGVEFFFIVSGFFLYKSFTVQAEPNPFRFIKHRIQKLYPDYLFAEIVAIYLFGIHTHSFDLSSAISELLMLQHSGLIKSSYNYPCWYMSVLMISSFLLYGILTLRKKDFVSYLGSILILFGYTFLVHQANGFEEWHCVGPISLPLLRGMAGMTLGILIAYLNTDRQIISATSSLVLEVFALTLIALGIMTKYGSEMLTVIGFVFLLISITYGENIFSKYISKSKLIQRASKYCYVTYLNQAVVIKGLKFCCKKAGFEHLPVWLFLVVLILYSLL